MTNTKPKSGIEYTMDAWPRGVALNPAELGAARGDQRTAGYKGKRASFVWQVNPEYAFVFVWFGRGAAMRVVEGELVELRGSFTVREPRIAARTPGRKARVTRVTRVTRKAS